MCVVLKTFITRPFLYFVGLSIFIIILFTSYIRQDPDIVNNCNVPLPCHCSETSDALPSAEDPNFFPKAKSIFFHETSCRSGLTIRQACSVEAAARAHPNRDTYVLFSAPVADHQLKTGCLGDLLKIPNVKFLRVHLAEYSKGTIVQSMLLNEVKKSRFRIHHAADVLRILTLSRWGGLYLDTDMIVTRSLDDLASNFVAKQYTDEIASGILSFAKDEIGTNFSNEVIKEINKEYDPTFWSFIGAEAIEKVLQRLCPKVIRSPTYLDSPISNCKGVVVYSFDLFYPIAYTQVDEIYSPPTRYFDLYRPYTYHMWNFLNDNETIRRGSVYQLVAQAFCPTIHSKYYYEFSAPPLKASTNRLGP